MQSPAMRWKDRGCVALSVAMELLAPAAAHATTASQSFTAAGEHVFTVPIGVTDIQAQLVGGRGGDGPDFGEWGGIGATLQGTLAVHPGQAIYVEVGGDGVGGNAAANAGFGDTNGGGGGGDRTFVFGAPSGGGGGGASDVRTVACPIAQPGCPSAPPSLQSRLLVAGGGGGGGGGWSLNDRASGGTGGAADGDGRDGEGDGRSDPGGGGAPRGTTTGGGAAGSGFGATAGTSGTADVSLLPTGPGAEPQIILTWTLPAPTATTQAASAITLSGATSTAPSTRTPPR